MNLNASSRTGHKWIFVVVPTIVIGLTIWAWFGFIKYHFVPKRFGVVEQGHIYRSGQLSATLVKRVLAEYNIRVIVDLTSFNPQNPDQQAEEKAAAELNITILRFPLKGNGTSDVNEYASAIAAIADAEKKNLPVLVHCAAGVQRTGGVIVAYRLLVQKKDPGFVEDELEKYGCDIDDKPVLFAYLNGNMAELAMLLKQSGTIEEIPSPLPQLPRD